MTVAATAELRQTHPIARAIRKEAQNRKIVVPAIDEASYAISYGISADIGGQHVRSDRFMAIKGVYARLWTDHAQFAVGADEVVLSPI